MVKPGHNNRQALHRHAVHALEDFDRLTDGLVIGNYRERNVSSLLHSLSHHLRHVLYRSGVETNWGKPVRRADTAQS